MLFADVVAVSQAVGATSARSGKIAAIADLFGRLGDDEIEPAVAMLSGEPRQGRIGVGWATIAAAVDSSGSGERPALTVLDVDGALTAVQASVGPGSQSTRAGLLDALFDRATGDEADFLRRLLVGELRQGASAGIVVDAVARAARVPVAAVRRALMLSGGLTSTARTALTGGATGLAEVRLEVLRPLQPMLASTADDVGTALDDAGRASVEWKLDGARIQVHRRGTEVAVFTRNLNDVTTRLPDVVDLVLDLEATDVVLDGEVVGQARGSDRPQAFQDTISAFARDAGPPPGGLVPYFFDLLHHDGSDLVDEPLEVRSRALRSLVGDRAVPAISTDDLDEARGFLDAALAAGHEGVMVKSLDSTYQAGRRGKAWRKVKPVATLDLVVLAAEWGHGRRTGWLSNLHLGARDDGTDELVMVGKTFKGLTDRLLTWQTEALLERETDRRGNVVVVRPELVVEIALDGAQASTRYPGGVALRFARVRGYRPDRAPGDADTLEAVRALLPGALRPDRPAGNDE